MSSTETERPAAPPRLAPLAFSPIALVEAMRPRQWAKNLIVFVGLIFHGDVFNLPLLAVAAGAFAIFCGLSSAVYLYNDVLDVESDRAHPLKRFRPIASGRLGIWPAAAAGAILAAVGISAAFWLGWQFGLIALSYLALNMFYSVWLKHIVIVDVFSIAIGFVLRAAGGAEAIRVEISPWLLVCTILLALFLALSKRRHELVLLENGAISHRRILSEYSPYLLDQMISVVTASTVVSYALYTLSPETVHKFHSGNMIFTFPFVLFGIFRYLYLVHQKNRGGSPEKIMLGDWPMVATLLLWLITAGVVIYW